VAASGENSASWSLHLSGRPSRRPTLAVLTRGPELPSVADEDVNIAKSSDVNRRGPEAMIAWTIAAHSLGRGSIPREALLTLPSIAIDTHRDFCFVARP